MSIKQSGRADIVDVARAAKVSASTVSRCFNHPELVNPATRRKINRAVEKLGYDPEHPEKTFWPEGNIDRLDSHTLMDLEILEAGSFFERTDPFLTLDQIAPQDLATFREETIPTLYDGLVITRELD